MARYIVDSQIDNHEKYYFIREQESQDIVLLPSKYLMHKKDQNCHLTLSEEVQELFHTI